MASLAASSTTFVIIFLREIYHYVKRTGLEFIAMSKTSLIRTLVTLGSALAMFTALSGAENTLPYDTHVVFRTHVPHLNSAGHGGGGGDAKPGSGGGGGAVFTGTPYTVGPTVTATTTAPEAEEHIAVNPVVGSFLVAAISDFSLRG